MHGGSCASCSSSAITVKMGIERPSRVSGNVLGVQALRTRFGSEAEAVDTARCSQYKVPLQAEDFDQDLMENGKGDFQAKWGGLRCIPGHVGFSALKPSAPQPKHRAHRWSLEVEAFLYLQCFYPQQPLGPTPQTRADGLGRGVQPLRPGLGLGLQDFQ